MPYEYMHAACHAMCRRGPHVNDLPHKPVRNVNSVRFMQRARRGCETCHATSRINYLLAFQPAQLTHLLTCVLTCKTLLTCVLACDYLLTYFFSPCHATSAIGWCMEAAAVCTEALLSGLHEMTAADGGVGSGIGETRRRDIAEHVKDACA